MKYQLYRVVPMIGVLVLSFASNAIAQIFTNQIVGGQANIYGAARSGSAATPAPGGSTDPNGNYGGVAAPGFTLTPGTNRILTMTSVSGTVTFNDYNSPLPYYDADGGGSSSSVTSYQGISGITFADRWGTLVGVFVNGPPAGFGDGSSGSSAPDLSYTASDLALNSFAPELNQSFFVGDGLTGDGTGTVQQFHVPDTATELFLGFSDGPNFHGAPGSYNDNAGSLTVSFQIVSEPTLIINKLAPSQATLSWPTNADGFALVTALSLPASSWNAVTNVPVVLGSSFSVTIPATNTQQYFRLYHQ
jgi:hypothetical protein